MVDGVRLDLEDGAGVRSLGFELVDGAAPGIEAAAEEGVAAGDALDGAVGEGRQVLGDPARQPLDGGGGGVAGVGGWGLAAAAFFTGAFCSALASASLRRPRPRRRPRLRLGFSAEVSPPPLALPASLTVRGPSPF
jgi:hypothetical protein